MFAYRLDTTYVVETDTLRIETTIRDTVVHQRATVKPQYLILRDTIPDAELIKAKHLAKMATEKTEKPTAPLLKLSVVANLVFITLALLAYLLRLRK